MPPRPGPAAARRGWSPALALGAALVVASCTWAAAPPATSVVPVAPPATGAPSPGDPLSSYLLLVAPPAADAGEATDAGDGGSGGRRPGARPALARTVAALGERGVAVQRRWTEPVPAVLVRARRSQAHLLAGVPGVVHVERNRTYTATDIDQARAPWGLDRIDQRSARLDGRYRVAADGAGVHVYVVDTGLRSRHRELTGRVAPGRAETGRSTADCNGHGTHVGGTAAGTTYGVAKASVVVPVRVLDCRGTGTTADIVDGLAWIARTANGPSVVNMSLGGPRSRVMNTAVASLTRAGITVVAAAGNEGADACRSSPGSASSVVTVGWVGRDDRADRFSNRGSCVDLWAPGTDIVSASHRTDTGRAVLSGTSMASPHVAGAAALYLQHHPCASPREVRDALVGEATTSRGLRLLYAAGSRLADPHPTQLVCGNGFESGDDGAWSLTRRVAVVDDPARSHSGRSHLRLGGTYDSAFDVARQRAHVPEGRTVATIGLWAQATTRATSELFQDYLSVTLSTPSVPGIGCGLAADAPAGWNYYECDVRGEQIGDGEPVNIDVRAKIGTRAGTVFRVDDITVTTH